MGIKLNESQKQIATLLAMKNPDADYMIRLSSDSEFALLELQKAYPNMKEELLKEKESHESHMIHLQSRIEKINVLLSYLEEVINYGNE